MIRFKINLAGALAALVTLLAMAAPALAKTYEVTRTDDPVPGPCKASDCSLREAISAANAHGGADTVSLRGGKIYSIEIPGANEDANTTGDLDVGPGGLTITRSGRGWATVDGEGLDRVLDIPPVLLPPISSLAIAHLTVRGGDTTATTDAGGGIQSRGELTVLDSKIVSNHAVHGGGGISALGALTVTHSVIASNEVLSGNGVYGGAGIGARGELKLSDVTVRGNTSGNSGGGVLWSAGFGNSNATLQGVSVMGNDAGTSGGGLYLEAVSGNRATIAKSTIAGNDAGQRGGGVYTAAELRIVKSTLNGNDAGTNGGGIANVTEGGGLPGALTMENDTVAGNSAGSFGGGIDVYDGATATLNNVTVVYNDADSDSLGPGQGGGVQNGSAAGAVTLDNSLIALNSGVSGPDCAGFGYASGGYNLVSTTADCTGIGATGDREVGVPRIGVLAANGGPTKTIALRKGSVAINHGGSDCEKTDQRGVKRHNCDIGAYERR
ncbi:MAG: choice-of-anchor Q domain-containing protein [Solirubrobacterales bacterium]